MTTVYNLFVTALIWLVATAGHAGSVGSPRQPDLALTIRLEKNQFEAGEPVVAIVQITNRAGSPYLAQTSNDETGAHDGFAFTLRDATGRTITAPPRVPPAARLIGSWNPIPAADKLERKLFMNYWFTPLEPGRYTLRGSYRSRTDNGSQQMEWPPVESAALTFEVVPVGSTKLDVRIQRLTAQAEQGDPVAVDFLGFTGDPYALAPLVAAAYHDEADIRRRAVNGLNYLSDPADAIKAVLQKLAERGPTGALVQWLHAHGVPAEKLLPDYTAAVAATDPGMRLAAVTGLRLLRNDATPAQQLVIRPAFLRALHDTDSEVRLEALTALMQEPDEPARLAIVAVAAGDPNPRLRRIAKDSLRARVDRVAVQ